MTRPWGLWLFANGAAVLLGLATGWFDVSIQGTLVACAASSLVLPLMGTLKKEGAHG